MSSAPDPTFPLAPADRADVVFSSPRSPTTDLFDQGLPYTADSHPIESRFDLVSPTSYYIEELANQSSERSSFFPPDQPYSVSSSA